MAVIELDSLIGPYDLSGVDFENTRTGEWEDASVMRFVLGGHIYVATEDPEDGYRSCLSKLEIVDGPPVRNVFPPVAVVGRKSAEYDDDIVEFVELATGQVVLAVGTGSASDYYPYFQATFWPERMSVNAGKLGV